MDSPKNTLNLYANCLGCVVVNLPNILQVVDRLNHDKKGLVEFLDYLTYVPLFVEIHDSVCGNPLDFTRTK